MLLLEAFVFGAPVITVMLGVPIWRSISDCRKGRTSEIRLLRWWLVCGRCLVSLLVLLDLSFPTFPLLLPPSHLNCGVTAGYYHLVLIYDGLKSVHPDLFQGLRTASRCVQNFVATLNIIGLVFSSNKYDGCPIKQVEFRPYSSELPVKAVLEVPKVALPAYCRPGFGPVWVLREKYQVNRTYPCKYTPGHLEMVDIGDDLFAKCKLEKITPLNLFKQALMVLFFSDQWIFSSTSQAGIALRKALGYISYAACYSALITGFARTVGAVRSMLYGPDRISSIDKAYFEVRLQLTCMFMASVLWGVWYNGHMEDLKFFISRLFAVAL